MAWIWPVQYGVQSAQYKATVHPPAGVEYQGEKIGKSKIWLYTPELLWKINNLAPPPKKKGNILNAYRLLNSCLEELVLS